MSSRATSPVGAQRPFIMRKGISQIEDLADGHVAMNAAMAGAKTVYYCDGNAGNDNNSGTGGWETSFKTLTVALAASQADIALNKYGWAARNVILCRADAFTEDLVLLAQKTDVIGLGSYNANARCALVGNHVPTATANAGYGTRFFNFHFIGADTAPNDLWTLDNTVSNLGFFGCRFSANESTTAATGAIVNTASPFMKLYNNEFVGKYTDAVIDFAAGDGFRGCRIVGNFIEGDENGIQLNSSTTSSTGATEEYGLIKDNTICTKTITIDENANIAFVVGNHLISEATTTAGAVDINLPTASGNYLAFATVNSVYPYVDSSS